MARGYPFRNIPFDDDYLREVIIIFLYSETSNVILAEIIFRKFIITFFQPLAIIFVSDDLFIIQYVKN